MNVIREGDPNIPDTGPLPLEIHNEIQRLVIEKMLGDKKDDYQSQSIWLGKYLNILSEIMNGTAGATVQGLARAGKIDEAVDAVIADLQKLR